MSAQLQPHGPAPLTGDKPVLLARLVEGLDAPALWWLSGYAAGLAQQPSSPTLSLLPGGATAAQANPRLSIVYGSQTGNARRLAERLAGNAEAAGLSVRLLRADAYPLRELEHERYLAIVISTQGEGEPPDDARDFVEYLSGPRAPQLKGLHYAVLGLGDSSYPLFCAIGHQLDARLGELGASRFAPVGAADVDIDTVATPWLNETLRAATEGLKNDSPAANVVPLRVGEPHAQNTVVRWTREQPFAAAVLANQRISGRDSKKDVRHLELSLEGSGLSYQPGDALGVWPSNPSSLVESILTTLQLDGDADVRHGDQSLPLRTWLIEKRELTRLSRPFVAAHAAVSRASDLNRLLAPEQSPALTELLNSHQPIDLLQRWPGRWNEDELVAALRPISPRLYSIASSAKTVGDEAHLTVDVLGYDAFDREHVGAASHYLGQRQATATAPIYIEVNERFRLPADGNRDLLMIGAGTGVAPFRAFLQERSALGASGKHWLLFGARHFRSEFLYQLEWQQALREGRLHKLDLAFSRDQAERIHVDQRLRENARDIYAWLENGAHVYVCGSLALGKSVHAALRDVLIAASGRNESAAEDYLKQLQQAGRYARDVY
jgi:sulfite reductase (NADPH) flavoprotein alpha-component